MDCGLQATSNVDDFLEGGFLFFESVGLCVQEAQTIQARGQPLLVRSGTDLSQFAISLHSLLFRCHGPLKVAGIGVRATEIVQNVSLDRQIGSWIESDGFGNTGGVPSLAEMHESSSPIYHFPAGAFRNGSTVATNVGDE